MNAFIDLEGILITSLVNESTGNIRIVIDSALTWLLSISVPNISPFLRDSIWESIQTLFTIILPHWNCNINILFLDARMSDGLDDLASELLRDM